MQFCFSTQFSGTKDFASTILRRMNLRKCEVSVCDLVIFAVIPMMIRKYFVDLIVKLNSSRTSFVRDKEESCRTGLRRAREEEVKERAREGWSRGEEDSRGVIDARVLRQRLVCPAIDLRCPPPPLSRLSCLDPRSPQLPGRISRITKHNGIYMVSHRDPFTAFAYIYAHNTH